MSAYVNHGRWVVDCSTEGCEGARLAADAWKPCQNCGRITEAVYPPNRLLIDVWLSRRIVPQTRNWYPYETVEDLVAENVAHEGSVN